jgi:hypothetical protein
MGNSQDISGSDISAQKVIALVQQRLTEYAGEGIGEAIAKVQSRRVTALAETAEPLTSQSRLRLVDSDQFNAGGCQKEVRIADDFRTPPGFDDYGQFDEACGREPPLGCGLDQFIEGAALRLVLKNCDQGRSVDDHQRGRPLLS